MINRSTFKCNRCGECCKGMIIKLDIKDIIRIEKLGYEDFTMEDPLGSPKPVLKRNKNSCIFLKQKENFHSCKIHSVRPDICREYPFTEEEELENCKPNWPFPSLESLKRKKVY